AAMTRRMYSMFAGRTIGIRVLVAMLLSAGCGRTSTMPSDSAATTPIALQVGVLGNAAPRVSPGATIQLWALASYRDGTTVDATNLAVWRTSNASVATVSSGGELRGTSEGEVDVVATYNNVRSAVHAQVASPGCEASTLSPASLVFGP